MRPCALSPPRLPTHKLSGSPCMLHRATSTGRAASQAIAAPSYEAAEQQLREWVRSQGGYVHPHLGVADPAPCGVRGIVAVQPIALEDLEKGPVISIPAHLHLTNSVAIDILQQAASAAAAETGSLDPVDIAALAAQHHLSHMQLIGAALALESNKGSSSMWAPYLQLLPEQPPCPWWLADAEAIHSSLEAVLGAAPSVADTAATTSSASVSSSSSMQHGSSMLQLPDTATASSGQQAQQGAWAGAICQQHNEMEAAACRVCELLVPGIQLAPRQVLWGMGQVASRSLGTRGGSGLVPYVDLLNHHPSARPPMLTLDDADQLAVTVVPIMEGEAVPLAPGQELYINYAGGFTPLEAFMKFGFVSPEWWQEQA